MSISEQDVTSWCKRALALVDGVTLDYLALQVAEGRRSWPAWATVRADGRNEGDVIAEMLAHIRDVGESATANGKAGYKVRIIAYRAKSPAGSRTFASIGTSDSDAEDTADGTPAGEIAATIGDLRRVVVAQSEMLSVHGAKGWELALRVVGESAQIRAENAELRGQLAAMAANSAPDPLRVAGASILQAVAPDVIAPFVQFAMAKMLAEQAPQVPPAP
jgi:hypothetical protein